MSIPSNIQTVCSGRDNPKLHVVSTGKPMEDFAESVARKHFVKNFPLLDIERIMYSDKSIETLVSENPNKILILREFRDAKYEIIPKDCRDFTKEENQNLVYTKLKKTNHYIFRQEYSELRKFPLKKFAIDFVFLVIIGGKLVRFSALETYGKEYKGPITYVNGEDINKYLRIVESQVMKESCGITFISHVDRDKYKTTLLKKYFSKNFKKV